MGYLICFLISMIPVLELRGAMVYAVVGEGLPVIPALLVCVAGNMLPVPFIYFFARKILQWGAKKRRVGKIFRVFLEKGERGGEKLAKKAGRGGLIFALFLFVGIPLPGTGAWTGTLAASFLKMGIRSTTLAVSLGVVLAGVIMTLLSLLGLHIFGF